jgi:hypothetical protein
LAVQKKRHHFVPVTYLRGFTDSEGFLLVSRKDDPERSIRLRPDEAAFRNYYYSQPLGDGTMNHNALEDAFSTLENTWPGIVNVLTSGRDLNAIVEDLIGMIGFQRVRVPAFREAIEQSLQIYARRGLEELKRRGDLPPAPAEVPDIFDLVEVTIDPHRSIHGMTQLLRGLAPALDTLGYQIVRNETPVDFITSDNPVSYFTIVGGRIMPYVVRPDSHSELIFPVTSRMAIVGSTADRQRFRRKGLKASKIRDAEKVRKINRTIAQFGYETLFSSVELPAAFVRKYQESPVLNPDSEGFHPDTMRMPDFVFGNRRKLLKWRQ